MKRGFSLVELSIVLVILGLLTGGILAGQSLIRASELRAFTTEAQRYHTALYTFRDKYFAYPGDFRDATKFWNRLNTNADCVSNSGLATAGSPGACDGLGNGDVAGATVASGSGESFQLWRHLALAGLIEGSYTGLAGTTASDDLDRGSNVPASKFANTIWRIYKLDTPPANAFNITYSNSMWGGLTDVGTTALRSEDMWNIDTKLDDGKPARGKVVVRPWDDSCTTAADASDLAAEYMLTASGMNCRFVMPNLF